MFVKHEDIAAQIEAAVYKSLAALAAANAAANASLVSVIADNVTKAISTFDATVNLRLADVRGLLNERRSAVSGDTVQQKDISRRVDFTYRRWEMFSADATLLSVPGRDFAGFSADLATFVADVEEDVVAGAPSRSTKLPTPDFAEESKVRFSDVIAEEDASLPARVCRAHVAGTARAFPDELEEANDEYHEESVEGAFPQVAVDDPESGVVWTHDVSLQL